MRTLFTPARGLALLLLLPLAGCDSSREDRLVDRWTLERVEDPLGENVPGPTGSLLVFELDGSFRIESGNDCSGTYASEYVVNQQLLELAFETCTEVATTEETDLALLLGAYREDVIREPALFQGEPSRLEILVFTPEADRRLTFRAHSR